MAPTVRRLSQAGHRSCNVCAWGLTRSRGSLHLLTQPTRLATVPWVTTPPVAILFKAPNCPIMLALMRVTWQSSWIPGQPALISPMELFAAQPSTVTGLLHFKLATRCPLIGRHLVVVMPMMRLATLSTSIPAKPLPFLIALVLAQIKKPIGLVKRSLSARAKRGYTALSL